MANKSYSQKLKDPRWQKKRLEALERDEWMCCGCQATDKTLHVHHGYYIYGNEPWEYPTETLRTYCVECHEAADEMRKGMQHFIGILPYEATCSIHDVLQELCQMSFADQLDVALTCVKATEQKRQEIRARRLGGDTDSSE